MKADIPRTRRDGPYPAAGRPTISRREASPWRNRRCPEPDRQSFFGSRLQPPTPDRHHHRATGRLMSSMSFHQALLGPTRAYWLDDPPDLSSKDATRQYPVDDPLLSCKQQVGLESPNSSEIDDPCPISVWGRIVDDTLTMRFPLTAYLRFRCLACRLVLDALQAEGRGFESHHLHHHHKAPAQQGRRRPLTRLTGARCP
jgi:hypothetical protein